MHGTSAFREYCSGILLLACPRASGIPLEQESQSRVVAGTMPKKILIMGLPGAGKTTLAEAVARRLNAVHFNADALRQNVNKDLGFSEDDRIEQARRMGWLCDQVVKT